MTPAASDFKSTDGVTLVPPFFLSIPYLKPSIKNNTHGVISTVLGTSICIKSQR